ncbi:MAG: hypothetical protein RL685_1938 [Pseudomonadota bacterium]|jgi:hypothetical protein
MDTSAPAGARRSVYTRWELGLNAAGRANLENGWTYSAAVDVRGQYWGLAARHSWRELGSLSGTLAPLGRVAGLFIEPGGGVVEWRSAHDEQPAAIGALAYEWSPWANVLGIPMALRGSVTGLTPLVEGPLQRAISVDIGLRFGIPL